MLSERRIERKGCPIVDIEQYPVLGPKKSLYLVPFDKLCCCIFVRTLSTNEPFIDVYVFDSNRINNQMFHRFVIAPGFILSEEEEDLLIKYAHTPSLATYDHMFQDTVDSIKSKLPFVNCAFDHPLSPRNVGLLLEWIYFSVIGMGGGVRNVLYKAGGLYNIAYNYEKLAFRNDVGTTPETICGAPLKLLRILNHPSLINNLYDDASFVRAKTVYRKYSSYIDELPSVAQWKYLSLVEKGLFGGLFKRRVYNSLANKTYTDKEMSLIEKLYSFNEAVGHRQYKELPGIYEIKTMVNNYERLQNSEPQFKSIKDEEASVYEYQGEIYSVILPESANDLYYEGVKQNNCLIYGSSILRHLNRETTILFLRDKREVTFVTLEIFNGVIEQCYGRNNTLPDLSVYQFLRDEYCKNKGFYADFEYLIFEGLLRGGYEIDKFNSLLEFIDSSDDPPIDLASDDVGNQDQVLF